MAFRATGAKRVRRTRWPLRLVLTAIALVGAMVFPPLAQARERIVSFDSAITVHPDASMTVTETIAVQSERDKIRRGIYREFPTSYRTDRGTRVTVGFQVLDVRRDGRREPFHMERRSNGVRLYIGDKNRIIPSGRHVYVIAYRTDRQLGFFDGFDELYWNVTGNGWAFDIERATAAIHLPKGAGVVNHAAYTGFKGQKGKDYAYVLQGGDVAAFETTRRLRPGEGLTVAVSWPPGFVARPSDADRVKYFVDDNRVLIAGLLALGILLVYYLVVWAMVGRDPEKGTIIPLYEPPKGFSPAAARYITKMGFDDKVFTAAIVSMAVKGVLTIHEGDDGTYTLTKTSRDAKLSPGERAVQQKLFRGGQTRIELKQKNHEKLQAAQKSLRDWLRTEFEKIYFVRNTVYFVPGIGLSAIALGIMVSATDQWEVAAFTCVWLAVWSVGVYFLVSRVITAWRGAAGAGRIMSKVGAIFLTLFSLPFLGGEVFGLHIFAQAVSPLAALILAAILLANFAFYHLLKAPTRLGRRIMDQIEGFATYLSVAEKDRMNFLNPPDRTPELFEKFLPYALALGVEQAWSEQFSDVLAGAGAPDGSGRNGYHPGWYSGRSFGDGGFNDLASSLGAGFSGAVASASTAPGSASGSGGGGSSGGGGGGGGGGGW